jgi:hypothetical protein
MITPEGNHNQRHNHKSSLFLLIDSIKNPFFLISINDYLSRLLFKLYLRK